MPETIYVANWERLQSIKWLPKAVQGRLFSTQYSHNDSALLFVWPNEVLENSDSLKVTMFIGCYDFLRKKNTSVKEEVSEKTNAPVPQDKAAPPKNEKDYQYIQALLDKILEVESNPDMASDEYIEDLIKQTDNAIQNIQE